MSTLSAMDLGLAGIQTGMNGLRRDAQQIATAPTGGDTARPASLDDATDALVDLTANRLQVEMSAKVIQTSADMIGSLLDIKV